MHPLELDMARVCVQGLGFVGTAMALAVASARHPNGTPVYDVVGVELDTPDGAEKAEAINAGHLPIRSSDPKLERAFAEARDTGNLRATTDPVAYEAADVAIVDIHLDLDVDVEAGPTVDFDGLLQATRTLAERMPEGSLIVVETTVPPGTCEKVIGPEIDLVSAERGLPPNSILLAHSYERVMPGPDYLDSIVNFWRVFAGRTPEAADACEEFLSLVVNVADYPLSKLGSTTASETAKLLENSYRAVTIAFMEEWGRLSEEVGVDLFQVIEAIRLRPTHSNMRQPGFGVGGYCLPKDPLFPRFGANKLLDVDDSSFPFSELAVETNKKMPMVTVDKLAELLCGLAGRRVLLLGVAYREGVGDTRFSPSQSFVDAVSDLGGVVVSYDPIVDDDDTIERLLPPPDGFDAVVFAVGHPELADMDVVAWLGESRPLVFDANRIFSAEQLQRIAALGAPVWAIGRGPIKG